MFVCLPTGMGESFCKAFAARFLDFGQIFLLASESVGLTLMALRHFGRRKQRTKEVSQSFRAADSLLLLSVLTSMDGVFPAVGDIC